MELSEHRHILYFSEQPIILMEELLKIKNIGFTHIPTGIVVQCQNERSQFQNKEVAMQMLKAKLYLMKQEENAEKLSDIRGDVKDINFGNQIRSYVMQPYTMVKDHRTGAESGNVNAVLDGDIDSFISAYLKWINLDSKK